MDWFVNDNCLRYERVKIPLRYVWMEFIHLVRTQNFLKKQHFLPFDTNTYVYVSWGKKCKYEYQGVKNVSFIRQY